MIELHLKDSTGSDTLQLPEAPFTNNTLEGAVDVTTKNMGMSTYYTANKREWVHTWNFMDKNALATIWGYYERQWQAPFEYPELSITGIATPVTDVKVRMYAPSKTIIDDCETYGGVQVTWREA